jgi:ribosomal protein S18 acetylase RimI-like enzyme
MRTERRAGAMFREIGMDAVADDEPATEEELLGFVEAGRAWVATDANDEPAGYLVLDVVDGAGHIEQVSVDPASAGRGLGRSLVEHAAAYARRHRLPALTLTTFAGVP